MNEKPLCCMIKNPTQEQMHQLSEFLEGNPKYIVHDENIYFYYPKELTEQEAKETAEDILKKRFAKGKTLPMDYTEMMARL